MNIMEDMMPDKLPWIYQRYNNIDWNKIDYDEFLEMFEEFDDNTGNIGMEFIEVNDNEEEIDWQSIQDIIYSVEQSIYEESSKRMIRNIDKQFEENKRSTAMADQMLRDIGVKLNE